jgi:hypothetical protein
MSDLRKKNYDKTKKTLLDALERIVERKPTVSDLIEKLKKNTLKINKYTVEVESGLSIGVLKNHEDVADKIATSSFKGDDASSKHGDSKKELKEAKDKLKQANKNIKAKQNKITNIDKALSEQVSQQLMLTVAMMEKIPFSDRKNITKRIISGRSNVVKIR